MSKPLPENMNPPPSANSLTMMGIALQKVGDALAPLDREAQMRVVHAVAILFDIELPGRR